MRVADHEDYLHDEDEIPADKLYDRMWSRVDHIRRNEDKLGLFSEFSVDKYPYMFWMNQMIGLTPDFGV